jgi:hypothetical protein
VPVLKLVCYGLGVLQTIACRRSDSIHFRFQIMSRIFGVFEKVYDVANAPSFFNHALCGATQAVHMLLCTEEGKSADVAAVL